MDTAGDRDVVSKAVLDSLQGWCDRDLPRMDREVRGGLVERWLGVDAGETLGRHRANGYVLELAGAGSGRGQGFVSERGFEVEVRDLDGGPPGSSSGWGSTSRQES